ncbi:MULTISPECIES: excinuclease ABC subunit UvrA [Microbacterium]|uniref:UvrABC system protein A n=1 Tax=Microbacterium wangchenii TaxID=2541726 RepID=A0ABX5SPW0_9MICO|nr:MULTISPECIES: excinuclease ABC subunit UvrA [Microbacterium]MCK6066877.1 excinuclease ABC subunit UvrA [Microbacterium sp. EYE_512]QBR88184.1 excinuclease ABC subunit UvrA [Microbacterium wangchenii]TXK18026.1 excinuclease ABC subunit UvrA [Microbacterium wangchenii]
MRPAAAALPDAIRVRGARVNNLKNIDVDVPLHMMVSIAGVSGSGKSSLALGMLYAEGSRRYVEALSTYTRRRLTQAARAAVDSVEHVPAALALRQRPAVPGVRSTFGTSTELLNTLRLIYSRLGSHECPNGHRMPPTTDVALDRPLTCPTCGAVFPPPSAESFAFNSEGACERCEGTGIVRDVDDTTLVPDETISIDDGAVAPWGLFGLAANSKVVAEMGVRTDVPFAELTARERRIVFAGPEEKRVILYPSKNGKLFELNATYRNAHQSVVEALRKAETESGIGRIERFLSIQTCPLCRGSRLNARARATLVDGITLAQATAKTLEEVTTWVQTLPGLMPPDMTAMAESIVAQMVGSARMLLQLGLGYLTLDRASSTLSTGERQRVQLSRAVRNRTTGVLYVLDEPSIGLHPSNLDGLIAVIRSLLRDGNSVVVVDHDTHVLREADWLIEIGPGSGADGGTVIAAGTRADVIGDPRSRIAPFLGASAAETVRERTTPAELFDLGSIRMSTAPIHTVQALDLEIPKGRLTAVTGVSGSGKTTVILESLVPALVARAAGAALPAHVTAVEPAGIDVVDVVDASPIGVNVRSTVATYSGVLDDLRRVYARTPEAQARGLTAGDFSYNTGSLRCPECDGTGQISLDVQFLPDVDIVCPACGGSRYRPDAHDIRRTPKDSTGDPLSLPALLSLTVDQALPHVADLARVESRLRILTDLGLGYLTLGEATTALSGGEAQRLKLSADIGRSRRNTLFVLDEPSIGLHPLDVRVLLGVLQRLIDQGATVVIIEHDLDMIGNADHIIDLGPGGGTAGGRIVATGTPADIAAASDSVTGRYLR